MYKTFSNETERILGHNLGRLESASLRHSKFMWLGGDSKAEQLSEVVRLAGMRRIQPRSVGAEHEFTLRLGGRLIVNMAVGVLENAGLALHRFHNYPYIPGSAVKGIARHAAWCEWRKATGGEKDAVDQKARKIFGTGFSETLESFEKGCVCFLAAVPADTDWNLAVDILTPHGGNDYTNPIPVPFLTVEKGAKFRFGLKTCLDGSAEHVKQADAWLRNGLIEHGAGAKTIAGYGWFEDGDVLSESIPVELCTPAFMGGASHENRDDTTLRPSSLRGLLRWWWRSLYRDRVTPEELKRLEDALWGSTSVSGMIRVRVQEENSSRIELFNFKDGFAPHADFAREHRIDPGRDRHAVHYLAYGMDEKNKQEVRQRFYVKPGALWRIQLSIREGSKQEPFTCQEAMDQALAALSLLTTYGGVGSKSRKGFGSLKWDEAKNLSWCIGKADELLKRNPVSVQNRLGEAGWKTALTGEIFVPCEDPWTILDRTGLGVKQVATAHKHEPDKAVFGLPRQIHGPRREPMPHQRGFHQAPLQLKPDLREAQRGNQTRYASPFHLHIEKSGSGHLVRIVAFPSSHLRSLMTSSALLQEMVEGIQYSLQHASWDAPSPPSHKSGSGYRGGRAPEPPREKLAGLVAGQETVGILQEEKTKKGGWKVLVQGGAVPGPVVNSGDVPSDKQPGDEVKVKINSASPSNPIFRFVE